MGLRLLSYHNVHFLVELMEGIRDSLENKSFQLFHQSFLNKYRIKREDDS